MKNLARIRMSPHFYKYKHTHTYTLAKKTTLKELFQTVVNRQARNASKASLSACTVLLSSHIKGH